jgi:hypothetical protein
LHPLHREGHLIERIGWLRAAVLGANDGIISTSSLVVGVAAASTSPNEVIVAGIAGLVAGATAMAAGLREVARIFRDEPNKIAQNRNSLVAKVAERARSDNPANIGITELDSAATSIARATDPVNGGLRGAPKFPQCAMLEFFWRAGARTKDNRFFPHRACADAHEPRRHLRSFWRRLAFARERLT